MSCCPPVCTPALHLLVAAPARSPLCQFCTAPAWLLATSSVNVPRAVLWVCSEADRLLKALAKADAVLEAMGQLDKAAFAEVVAALAGYLARMEGHLATVSRAAEAQFVMMVRADFALRQQEGYWQSSQVDDGEAQAGPPASGVVARRSRCLVSSGSSSEAVPATLPGC